MILYLVQHGKCLTKDEDPGRPLSDTGREQTRKIAEIIAGAAIPVMAVRHSGKLRAKQTAELFASVLGVSDVKTIEGLQPLDDVDVFARKLAGYDRCMLVGHLPFMGRLTSFLLTGK